MATLVSTRALSQKGQPRYAAGDYGLIPNVNNAATVAANAAALTNALTAGNAPTNAFPLCIEPDTYYSGAFSMPAKRGGAIFGLGGVGYWDDGTSDQGAQVRLVCADTALYSTPPQEIEIASVTNQNNFVLSTSIALDDAMVGQTIIINDDSTGDTVTSSHTCTAYDGTTKTITVDGSPSFTVGADDSITIVVPSLSSLKQPFLYLPSPGAMLSRLMLFGRVPTNTTEPIDAQADIGIQIPTTRNVPGAPGKCGFDEFYFRNFLCGILFGERDGTDDDNADNCRLGGLLRFDGCTYGVVTNSDTAQNITLEQVNFRRGDTVFYHNGGGVFEIQQVETLKEGGTVWRIGNDFGAENTPLCKIGQFHSDALDSTPLYPFKFVTNEGTLNFRRHHFVVNGGDWGNSYLYGGDNRNGGPIIDLFAQQRLSMRDVDQCYNGMIKATKHSVQQHVPNIVTSGCSIASGEQLTIGGIRCGPQLWVEPGDGFHMKVESWGHRTHTRSLSNPRRFVAVEIDNYNGFSREWYPDGTMFWRVCLRAFPIGTPVSVGDGAASFVVPNEMDGAQLVGFGQQNKTPGSGGTMLLTLRNTSTAEELLQGSGMTVPSGDAIGEDGDYTIQTAGGEDIVTMGETISLNVDQVHSTTAADGMLAWLLFK